MNYTHAFAVPGEPWLLDCLLPGTDRADFSGKTLEQIRVTHPGAVVVRIADWISEKADADAAIPLEWHPISESQYTQAMGCLPPAAHRDRHFLLGEPHDSHPRTGAPRFTCYLHLPTGFFCGSKPLTVQEFRTMQIP